MIKMLERKDTSEGGGNIYMMDTKPTIVISSAMKRN